MPQLAGARLGFHWEWSAGLHQLSETQAGSAISDSVPVFNPPPLVLSHVDRH